MIIFLSIAFLTIQACIYNKFSTKRYIFEMNQAQALMPELGSVIWFNDTHTLIMDSSPEISLFS